MFKIRNYFIFVVIMLVVYPVVILAETSLNTEQNQNAIKQKVQKPVSRTVKQPKPALTITPEDIYLGAVTSDKPVEGIFTLKNAVSGVIDWSTEGPEGWKKPEQQKLSGSLDNKSESLRVEIRLLHKESLSNEDKKKNSSGYVEMKLESGGGKIVCAKEFPAGTHKEEIKINTTNGQKTISLLLP